MSDKEKRGIVMEIISTPFDVFKMFAGIEDTPSLEERQTRALEKIAKNGK